MRPGLRWESKIKSQEGNPAKGLPRNYPWEFFAVSGNGIPEKVGAGNEEQTGMPRADPPE